MPPKAKDVKKGALTGNFKAGKPLKDILPPNCKPPREGAPLNGDVQPDVHRTYMYEPYANVHEWPGNDEAKNNDFTKDAHKGDDGGYTKYVDNTPMHLPPSYQEFEKNEIQWLRPDEYLKEISFEHEQSKRRLERKLLNKKLK